MMQTGLPSPTENQLSNVPTHCASELVLGSTYFGSHKAQMQGMFSPHQTIEGI